MKSPKVSVILLNLNNHKDTRECIASLLAVRYSNVEIVVVDNGSSDDSCARLEEEFSEVTFMRTGENLGFAEGNNVAIRAALQNGTDYVLLLNNDTIVHQDFLSYLVDVAETDSQIGLLAPKIFYESDPCRIWYAGGEVNYWTGMCDHRGYNQLDNTMQFSHVEDTQFITGCAMMIKVDVVRKVGMLDSKLFIYWEDSDFSMRARKAGFRCVFVPQASVWHKVSRTCGIASAFTLFLTTRNQLTWIAKHVPFPYKPVALFWQLAKRLIKGCLLVTKDVDLTIALWSGVSAFMFRIYGPPQREIRSKRPAAVAV